MRKIFVIVGLLMTWWGRAQEAQFSQYFATSAYMNPAFAGVIPNLNINTNYKRGGDINTDSFLEVMQSTFTYPINRFTSKEEQVAGVGATFFRERRGFQGVFRSQKFMANAAYSIQIARRGNQTITFGLQGGVVQHDILDENFTWGSQYNRFITGGFDETLPGENISNATIWYPIFNVGFIYSTFDTEDYYVRDYSFSMGLSVDNLNRPNISVQGLDDAKKEYLFKGFATARFALGSRFYAHPSTYILNSAGSYQVNAGMYISTYLSSPSSNLGILLQTGAWYRLNDSIILLGGFRVDKYTIGVSVDLNATDLDLNEELGGNEAAYEISLSYNLDISKAARTISSPIF